MRGLLFNNPLEPLINNLVALFEFITSLPGLFLQIIRILSSLQDIIYGLFSSILDGILFISSGLTVVTSVIAYAPGPFQLLVELTIAVLSIRFILDLI